MENIEENACLQAIHSEFFKYPIFFTKSTIDLLDEYKEQYIKNMSLIKEIYKKNILQMFSLSMLRKSMILIQNYKRDFEYF